MPSRRGFIVAASAVVAGTVLLLRRGGPSGAPAEPGGITVLPGSEIVSAPVPGASNPWLGAIGETVRIAGESVAGDATIAAVVREPLGPVRPAGLRQQSLLVYFEMDARIAPAGNGIYAIGRMIDGLDRLFLTRGDDRAGKAILMAVIG